ncbi:sensor histidine kinase [Paenibacillus hamazuiensis]|uniref:sensor histidine kinase n=1 Tax=Paenibacillus hamazuiensis TaxID=2936508 RepID=UPI00200BEAC9|nr:HAMP domain-containing sensor histidine kinase [Paenibacillus hamazuiensis]
MNSKPSRQVFETEIGILKSAKRTVLDPSHADNVLTPQFRELVNHYERLLRMSIKIFNISDIQGKHLKEHELELQRVNEQLNQLEQARRQLITDISHELGTPMTSIQGYVKAMLDGIIKPTPHYLNLVHDKITHVNLLVDELFEISKLESSQTMLDYADCSLADVQNMLEHRLEAEVNGCGYELRLDRYEGTEDPDRVRLSIDTSRIEQATRHLVFYAMKHTPPGGRIGLRFDLQEAKAGGEAGIKDKRSCELVVTISDFGLGIDQANFSLLMDRAQRSDLGLTIAKIIVLKHQGQMGVREPGKNEGSEKCRVYFSLPAVLAP